MNETYIKMCAALPKPVQDMIPDKYDTLYCDGYNTYFHSSRCQHIQDTLYAGDYPDYIPLVNVDEPFKIPNQETLQTIADEMMGVTLDLVILAFYRYYDEEYIWAADLTMIWLCFVLWKCFNLEWNDCSWEAI